MIDTEASEGYDTGADVWSLGVTGLELWEAEPPLAGVPPMKAFSLITRGPHPLVHYQMDARDGETATTWSNETEILQTFADTMHPEMLDFLSK